MGLGYIAAATVIAFAILLGLASIALPMVAQHPRQVRAWLEHRTGRTVAFRGLHTQWTRFGPLIQLEGLRLGDGANAVAIGDAELLASVYLGLLPGHAFTELRLRGLDLTLERAPDGTWQVRGLPGQQRPGGDPFAALERLGEVQVIGGRLAIVAPANGINLAVPRVDLRLRVEGARVRAGLRAWPRLRGLPVDAVLDFDRTNGTGDAYAGATDGDLADWSGLLHAGGVRISGGRGTARAWAHLRAGRVTRVVAQGALASVVVDGARLDSTTPQLRFDRLDVMGRWVAESGGWKVAFPRLGVRQGNAVQVLDGLSLGGGERFALHAYRVDVAPLLQVAALTDRLPPAARRWLRAARPFGVVQQVHFDGRRSGGVAVDAQLLGMGFVRVGAAPGVSGVSGHLQADTDGVRLDFDPTSPVRVSWPQAFGADHVLALAGGAGAWRETTGWRVGSSSLQLAGQGFSAGLRGSLWWQGDGSRPRADLAADIGPASITVARRLWMRQAMAPPLVRWLDQALLAGQVQGGRVLIVGDLDDWPFRHGEGQFEARAHVAGATVKFQPEWPAADAVDADLVFTGIGFQIAGRGRIAGVPLETLGAGIDDYRGGSLAVTAHAKTDAASLLALVRASPLQKVQPETVAALTATGPAQVDFGLTLPLGGRGPLAIAGDIDFDGASLADSRWNLRFDQVRGRAHYDRSGFDAANLSVLHEGQSGSLALRAGDGHVRDASNVFEAGVDASFDIDQLLARAPEMGWLAPYVAGRSTWTVGVVVPHGAAGHPAAAHLQLRSNLAGTSLDLPAPLRKPAAQALGASVDSPLPLGSGEVVVGLGNLVGVRARTQQGRTGVRVQLGAGSVPEAPPAEGLVATGRTNQLDALDWIAFTRGAAGSGGSGSAGGLSLQRIDVTAQHLLMLGGQFDDERLQVAPAASGIGVRVDGATLSGSLRVPGGAGAVTGRFARVFWKGALPGAATPTVTAAPSPSPVSSAPGSATLTRTSSAAAHARNAPAAATSRAITASGASSQVLDPAHVPALALDVDDLRIGAAQLGVARLRTRPTASGLHVDQFTARGRDHQLDVSGDWTGRGAASRTHLVAAITSGNFGALLDGLGFGGRLGGGKGSAHLDAGWPGTPADFRVATIDGALTLDARDGRLLEVEPGAGRVLGLLSLAELPRRLTLDFRDFFSKGFSFNKVGGTVRFAAGLAHSDGLAMRGSAADIDIRGTANLRLQTFDQTIEVRPKSGNLLTAVGALAGGPVGAAIGAAANAVLRKPLGQLGAKTYHVTGPWADPKVEVMSRAQTRARAPTAPAPAG